MADIDLLLDQILQSAKSIIKDAFESDTHTENYSYDVKIYTDEPITIPKDRDLSSPSGQDESESYVPLPAEYRNMRKIARRLGSYRVSDEALFYEQGKYMENFEDDFEYHGHFSQYFPTYQSMNDADLRGYFSWRTKVRRGQIEETSLSFAFVYIYELLNQIGVASPREGYDALKNFQKAYRRFNPGIDRYMKTWLWDYVIYYQLDLTLLDDTQEAIFDHALLTLLNRKEADPRQLFSALNVLSTYNMEKSKLYKQYPEDVIHITYAVYDQLCDYYEKHRATGLFENLFGTRSSYSYFIFSAAVFYDQKKYEDYTYEPNPIHTYHCLGGKWRCEKYYSKRKNPQLGAILKTIDSRIRQKYGLKPALLPGTSVKYLNQIIDKEIDSFLEAKKQAEAPKIDIDLSKLSHIRQTASIIQDKLLVDETEPTDKSQPVKAFADTNAIPVRCAAAPDANTNVSAELPNSTVWSAAVTNSAQQPASSELLDPIETMFMRHLIVQAESGMDPNSPSLDALLKQKGILPAVLVDTINEKLFDTFDDTVILCDKDTPELIEDYIDDLKEMFKNT